MYIIHQQHHLDYWLTGEQIQRAGQSLAKSKRTKIMFPSPIAPVTSTSREPSEIDVAELATRLRGPQPPLVAEILGPHYFASGHLPGALNLPLEAFVERAAQALPSKQREIVVYCASATCQNSDIAARKLLALGYVNVRVFRGGKAAWRDAGHPLVT
jgi:rhodanese-related sulfurtransferase